jgi:hypothetical protein
MQKHIAMLTPLIVTITVPPHNLLADNNTASNQTAPVAGDALIANAQALLDQVKADLNLTQGEVTMFIPDMPNVPPQDVPVMIAQANQAQPHDVTKTRTLGVCYPASLSGEDTLSPIASAGTYLYLYEHQKSVTGSATVTVLQHPKHGILRLVTEADRGTLFDSSSGPVNSANSLYAYLPEQGYLKDSGTLLVDFGGGLKVKVVYFFQHHEGSLGNTGWEDLCSKTGKMWKISSTLDANGNSTITSVEYQSPVITVTVPQLHDDAATNS